MDIDYFKNIFSGEYELVRLKLEQARDNSEFVTAIPDLSGIDEKTEKNYRALGMSDAQINEFRKQLQDFACKQVPLHHGGISVEDMLDYVEGFTSGLDNKRIFLHLEACLDCRLFLFEKMWFMLEP